MIVITQSSSLQVLNVLPVPGVTPSILFKRSSCKFLGLAL
jgi:hypothetical protein